jgi:hypothetical protein
MSVPTRGIMRLIGVALSIVGAMLSYNGCVGPEYRFGGHALDGWMLRGEAILTIGLLLVWSGRGNDVVRRRSTGLLWLGLSLLAIPALLLIGYIFTRNEELFGFLFAISAQMLGLPGLILVSVAMFRRWTATRGEHLESKSI